MILKDFSNLIEIQSLQNFIKNHLNTIDSQEKRISNLATQREHKQQELNELKTQITSFTEHISENESLLYTLEKNISKAKENSNIAKNQNQLDATLKELKSFIPRKEELEIYILEEMEKLEESKEITSELKEFLSGSEKTIHKIKDEVDDIIKKETTEINSYNTRINNLISLLPKDTKEIFLIINKKYQYNNPIVYIIDNACPKCKYPIERNLSSLIEKGNILELCPGCERILAPRSAAYTNSE